MQESLPLLFLFSVSPRLSRTNVTSLVLASERTLQRDGDCVPYAKNGYRVLVSCERRMFCSFRTLPILLSSVGDSSVVAETWRVCYI